MRAYAPDRVIFQNDSFSIVFKICYNQTADAFDIYYTLIVAIAVNTLNLAALDSFSIRRDDSTVAIKFRTAREKGIDTLVVGL